jgi:7-cyano-7-deazaguanine synthase
MKSTEVVLLLSGGIDSTTLLAKLHQEEKQIHALSFDYGQRHKIEIEYAKRNAKRYGVKKHYIIQIDAKAIAEVSSLTNYAFDPEKYIDNPPPDHPSSVYVPGRNLIMISHAASYAEANKLNEIYFAVNNDDAIRFPDCSKPFVSALNQFWQCVPNTRHLNLVTPFIDFSKAEVISLSMKLKVDISQTLSCYNPISNNECCTCLSCVLKKEALLRAITISQ